MQARISSSRLQTAQTLLYTSSPGCLGTARLRQRSVGCLGYDKELFLLPEDVTPLQARQTFRVAHTTDETPGMRLFEDPLDLNSFPRTQTMQSASQPSVDALRTRSNITSVRLVNRAVEEFRAALPLNLRMFAGNSNPLTWTGLKTQEESPLPGLSEGPGPAGSGRAKGVEVG